MKNKKGVLSIKLVKKEGKLVHQNESDATLYKIFIKSLSDGQVVDVFFDAHVDGGTFAQISKLKVSIKELASESGHSFEEMQNIVKERAGLCWDDYCKSFASCSIEELSLAIEATLEIGDDLNINLRQIFPEK